MPTTRSAPITTSSKLTPLQLHRKVGMLRKGISAADIARKVGVTRSAVSMVILDQIRSKRIETEIAVALDEPVDQLFPQSAA